MGWARLLPKVCMSHSENIEYNIKAVELLKFIDESEHFPMHFKKSEIAFVSSIRRRIQHKHRVSRQQIEWLQSIFVRTVLIK